MQKRILIAITLIVIFTFTVNAFAIGQNSSTGIGGKGQQQTQTTNQGEDSQIETQNNEQTNKEDITTDQAQNQNKKENTSTVEHQNLDQNQEQNQEQEGQINAEQHRSTVANFVHTLLKTASSTENRIGEQVRAIAQEQNASEATTTEAIDKIQSRNKIQTFLFGSDYKNLGALRSEMVQTMNRLDQLNRLMENVQNEGDKTELQNQIQTLEQEQTKIENFITAQESRFSLFGWLVKLFNK